MDKSLAMDPGDNIWAIYIKVSYLEPRGSTKLLARFTNSVIGGLLGWRVDRPEHAALLSRLNKYSDHKTFFFNFRAETVFVPCFLNLIWQTSRNVKTRLRRLAK